MAEIECPPVFKFSEAFPIVHRLVMQSGVPSEERVNLFRRLVDELKIKSLNVQGNDMQQVYERLILAGNNTQASDADRILGMLNELVGLLPGSAIINDARVQCLIKEICSHLVDGSHSSKKNAGGFSNDSDIVLVTGIDKPAVKKDDSSNKSVLGVVVNQDVCCDPGLIANPCLDPCLNPPMCPYDPCCDPCPYPLLDSMMPNIC